MTTSLTTRVLDLIPLIYDAAMDASRWQTFLEALGGLYPDSGRALWSDTAERMR